MREIGLIIILLFCCVLFSGCVNSEPETYVVALDPALQPLSVKSPTTGEPEGFDVDMLEWIAHNQNIQFTYEFVTLQEYMDELNSGRYDLKPSIIITDARKAIFDMSDPYLDLGYTLIAKKDSGITMENMITNDDLVIATVDQASALISRLQEYIGRERYDQMLASGKIITKATMDEAVYAVISGEADMTICADTVAAAQTEDFTDLSLVGYLDGEVEDAIALPKGNSALLAKLNAGIANFKASPEYNQLRDKYSIPYLKDTYVVGIDSDNIPFTYLDENGDLTGFDYESILWIANNSGFNVTFTEGDWATNINALIAGDIDMWYSGMTITPERSEVITFSDPYLNGGIAILTLENKTVTQSEFESGSVVIGAMLDTTNAEWAKDYFGDRYASMYSSGQLVMIPDQGDMFDALAAGEVDCIIVDELGHRTVMQEKGLQLVATYPYDGDAGVAIRNGDVALLNALNRGLSELETSGIEAQLKEKYLL